MRIKLDRKSEMQYSEIKEKIERNFYRIRVAPRSTLVREWEKLDPSQIIKLLKSCSLDARHQAKHLIIQMATKKWTLTATAHSLGSKKQDDPLHISIKIGSGKAHHLYCRDLHNKLFIHRITSG